MGCRFDPWLFPGEVTDKEYACQRRSRKRCRFNPWVRKMPWRSACNPLQYPCLENPMDRGAWQDTVQGVTKSQTWLNDFYLSQEPFSNLFFPKPDSHFPSIAFSLKWWDSDRGSPLGADGKAHFSDERNRHSWSSPPVCLKWGHEA